MNKENFQKIIDLIEANGKNRFDMAQFHSREGCGTVACVAGFAAMLAKKDDPDVELNYQIADTYLGYPTNRTEYGGYNSPDITSELYYARSIEEDHWDAGDRGRDGYTIISENYQQYALDVLKWMLKNDNYNWKNALIALEVYDPKNNISEMEDE